jgi:micrococcal nuclease
MGTTISQAYITDVIDGDTVKVRIDRREETVRIGSVDTEESKPGGAKPITRLGMEAALMAKQYFTTGSGEFTPVDLEFDTDETIENCFTRHRDNYGRLICYVYREGESFNLKLIRDGWSPYFVKYGRSRMYHTTFTDAEAEAQAVGRRIWDPFANAGGPFRDYSALLPWWAWRAHIVEEYRERGIEAGALSVRLDYRSILEAADSNERIRVLCDLQNGIAWWPGDGALVKAGSKFQPFNLWIPNAQSERVIPLIRLIEKRYAGYGRGYVYVIGNAKNYRGVPEIEVTDLSQLNDFPPPAG